MFARNRTKPAKKTYSPNLHFHLESLEERQMMAGDIVANVVNGDLYITEVAGQSGQDNGIRIAQLSNGNIQVLGTIANNSSTSVSKVNGQASAEFTLNGNLFISLGAGNDRVQIGFDGGQGAPTFNNMQIDVGNPPPVLAQGLSRRAAKKAFKAATTALNRPDDDQVLIWSANTRGSVSVKTGPGNDWAFLGSANIGDGFGTDNLTINTGAGGDQVTLKGTYVGGNVDIQTYSSLSENDEDGVYMDAARGPQFPDGLRMTTIDGDTNVRMGGGEDHFNISDPNQDDFWVSSFVLQTHGSLLVDTGAGNDHLLFRKAWIGEDNGDDVIFDNLIVNTGEGVDDVRFVDFNVGGFFDLQTYEVASEAETDTVTADNLTARRNMSFRMGAGNDQLTLNKVTTYRDLNVAMGDGDDRLDLQDYVLSIYNTNLFGGNGIDRFTYRATDYLQNLNNPGWEYINGRNQVLVGTTSGGGLVNTVKW